VSDARSQADEPGVDARTSWTIVAIPLVAGLVALIGARDSSSFGGVAIAIVALLISAIAVLATEHWLR
jgi:hypothetical protein